MGAATTQNDAHPIGSNSGLSVLPKDGKKD